MEESTGFESGTKEAEHCDEQPAHSTGQGFEEFKSRFLTFTPNLYTSIKELVSAPPKADIYITGSDQVWNYKFIGDFESYFLQFGNQSTRRISYAASFGHRELPPPVKSKYTQYLETPIKCKGGQRGIALPRYGI